MAVLEGISNNLSKLRAQATSLKEENAKLKVVNPLDEPTWCYGNPYYGNFFILEEESVGDGFTGDYYNNEAFFEKPLTNAEKKL
jgi:hypothetical protein